MSPKSFSNTNTTEGPAQLSLSELFAVGNAARKVDVPEVEVPSLEPEPEQSVSAWNPTKTQPMLRHYLKVKAQYRDHLILYQVGDFFEVFFEDAEVVSGALNIRLTSRDKDQTNPIPMCGIPIHAIDNYLPKLLASGYSCVVYSQVEGPSDSKGSVKREVTRVVTPGVRFEGDGLEEKRFNYLAAAVLGPRETGAVAFVDVSTGNLRVRRIDSKDDLMEALQRVQPSELILPSTILGVSIRDGVGGETLDWVKQVRYLAKSQGWHLVTRPFDRFSKERISQRLEQFFRKTEVQQSATEVLSSLVPDELSPVGVIFDYVEELSVGRVPQFSEVSVEEQSRVVLVDHATCRNLELLETRIDSSRKYSLVGIIDSTQTAMGARTISEWIVSPSAIREEIEARHEAVAEFYAKPEVLEGLRQGLAGVRDLDRIASRITSLRATPRDLFALGESLAVLPEIAKLLESLSAPLLRFLHQRFDVLPELKDRLQRAIHEEPPAKVNEGGIFKDGYSKEVDSLRSLSKDARQWLAEYENSERARTAIPGLKVRYNNVFGYFIEITRTHLSKVPDNYERKQTLSNAERFVTKELKEHEQAVLSAKVRQVELEKELFQDLRSWVAEQAGAVQAVSQLLALIDVLAAFADVARRYNYRRPRMFDDRRLIIKGGRHPVIERVVGPENFVTNDVMLDESKRRFAVLTGPNMGGKSTYLRQIGLIQLLAQAGSFVPAEDAELGVVDRIFTRIGAADDLTRGDSTFMVEMREAATIVRKASDRSLVLIDEIGRGTATTDGLAIATAIAEWLLDYVGCKTVFATHFHELTELGLSVAEGTSAGGGTGRQGAFCLSVGVEEQGDDIRFTHRIEERVGDRSYGIEVAKLAGLPQSIISRATELLEVIEQGERAVFTATHDGPRRALPAFERKDESKELTGPVLDLLRRVRALDLNTLTPLEALMELSRLQQMAAKARDLC